MRPDSTRHRLRKRWGMTFGLPLTKPRKQANMLQEGAHEISIFPSTTSIYHTVILVSTASAFCEGFAPSMTCLILQVDCTRRWAGRSGRQSSEGLCEGPQRGQVNLQLDQGLYWQLLWPGQGDWVSTSYDLCPV